MPLDPRMLGIDQWRPGQYQAVVNSRASSKRFVGQCAPVGSGKSHMLMGEAIESGARTLVLTGDHALQKQYSNLFSHLNLLDIKGKANYACRAMEPGGEFYDGTPAKSVADGPCQFGEECGLRLSGCRYYDKIARAKYAKRVSTNYAAWISANLYTEGWGKFDLILADEAHSIDGWLAKMLAVRFPRCHANLTGSKLPGHTNIALWVGWAQRELAMVRAAIRLEKKTLAMARRKRVAKLRTLQSLESSLLRMSAMSSEWRVFHDKAHVLFQPIWVHEYAEALVFGGADKVVFASSTMVPNTLNMLGVLDSEMDFFTYPSTFPPERRPIYYHPVVWMKHGISEEEELKWVDVVDNFISQRLDRKGLIHTVSYARQNFLLKHSKFASLMVASSPSAARTGSTSSANTTLQKFQISQSPSILIGPNWSTGIDLPYKQAQYTIIPKMPFPDMTDPLLAARAEDHPDYAYYHAGIAFTQSIGRAMRAVDDLNETLVTDAAFGAFMSRYRNMIAEWVWSSVKRVATLPAPLEALL